MQQSEASFRKQAAAARILLAAIVESSNDAIISKTLDGEITSWNRAAEQLFGYTEQEIVGRSIRVLIPADRHDEEDLILGRLRLGEQIEHYETIRVAKDGRQIHVSLTVSPLRDDSGRVVGASNISRDISERKQFEQERDELLLAERAARSQAERESRIKDEFLATLSHELRTPLNAILGWTQLLRRGPQPEAPLPEGLEVIERNARLQKQLIEDLLDMSRIISGKVRLDVQPVHLAGVIEQSVAAVQPSAEAKGIRLQIVLDPIAGPVKGDPGRLQQVVWNLLSNAVKFTPKAGRVQVCLERVNSHVEIVVSDSGEGIRSEFLPHVFDRFRQADSGTTRRHGGLGLGLSIVKQLVELHGGSVSVRSSGVGQGATFVVALPLPVMHGAENHAEARVHPASGGEFRDRAHLADLTGLTILAVDDEPDARNLIQLFLEQCGATVITASSASEALEWLRGRRPDVLISDVGMPDVDGLDLIRQVRAVVDGFRLPAIALTAFARSEDRTRSMLAGYNIHLAKPVEPMELVATVASLLGRTG